MKSLILFLVMFLGISNVAEAQFIVVYPQVRYYNNYGYNNYNYNNYGYRNYGYNNYNYGYNNYNYGYNNNWNRYVTPSGYMPFNNPYFQMATQGIGRGW
jgi:hypothetical protein